MMAFMKKPITGRLQTVSPHHVTTHAWTSLETDDVLFWGPSAINPQCPKGIMQFQHGTYAKHPNGSLVLSPFAVDGRQLVSDPCKSDKAQYLRYNQTELFKVGDSSPHLSFLQPALIYW
jgi:hypothetical protein